MKPISQYENIWTTTHDDDDAAEDDDGEDDDDDDDGDDDDSDDDDDYEDDDVDKCHRHKIVEMPSRPTDKVDDIRLGITTKKEDSEEFDSR